MAATSGPGCICVDGRLLAPHQATVSALDAGFLLGDGLFESLHALDGSPYLLDRHLERLYAGAEELGFEGMPTRELLCELVLATLTRADLDDAYLRVTVTRGRAGVPPAPPDGSPTVVIAALPAPARRDPADGIDVALVGEPSQHGPKAKSTSRQGAVTAKLRAERSGAQEGLYVSARRRVLEGTASNVFALSAGRLLTPPAEDCLPGITRGRLLELARQDGIKAIEAPLEVEALLSAEEAFVTNAVQGLRAIDRIDGHSLPSRGEGGVFARLASLYKADRTFGKPDRASGKPTERVGSRLSEWEAD
ncbi:MAG TPA: aminotransferase class IV [Solirubrobacteraceae bacterium]|nr:aminotransferase class IV [Solirubrobacteraceae bacterium]